MADPFGQILAGVLEIVCVLAHLTPLLSNNPGYATAAAFVYPFESSVVYKKIQEHSRVSSILANTN